MSLAKCLLKQRRSLSADERKEIVESAQRFVDTGLSPDRAAIEATRKLLREAEEERADYLRQVAAQAVTQPAPAKVPRQPFNAKTPMQDERLTDEAKDLLQHMVQDAGWAEVGGRLIRNLEGDAVGRTKWIPKAEWWTGGISESGAHEAVRKAVAGEPMGKKEKAFVSNMLDYLQDKGALSTPKEVEAAEQAAVAQIEISSPEQWATMTEDEKEDELDRIFGANTRDKSRQARAVGEGEAGAEGRAATGSPGSAEGGALEIPRDDGRADALRLETQTEKDLAEKAAREQAAAEAQSQVTKEQADREAAAVPFTLSMQSQPSREAVTGGQEGLFTPDGRAAEKARSAVVEQPDLEAEGYKKAGEPYFKDGRLVQGYATFAPGDRVRHKGTRQIGTVAHLIGPGPIFGRYVVEFPLGRMMIDDAGIERAPAPEQGTFDPANADIRFSTAVRSGAITEPVLRQMVANLTRAWKNAPPVEIVASMADPRIPATVREEYDRQMSQGAQGEAEAFWHDGKVWLVVEGISSVERAKAAILHEALGHYGLRGTFGEKLDSILHRVALARRAEVRAKAQQYGLDFEKMEDRLLAAEEVLAEMAQNRPEIGFVREAIAAIKAFLRRIGMLDAEQMSDEEIIREYLMPARDYVVMMTAAAHGAVRFSRPVREEGVPRAAATPLSDATDIGYLKAHADYRAAKAGDMAAAVRLVADLVKPESLRAAAQRFGAGAIYVAPTAQEASGTNAIPATLAQHYASATGGTVDQGIVQANRVYHTGAGPMERLIARPLFDGPVQAGGRYVLVDDVTTMGSTLAELADHIRAGGGEVVGAATLVNAGRSATLHASKPIINLLERRFGDAIRTLFQADPRALTSDEATYLAGFRDAQSLRDRAAKAGEEAAGRLRARASTKASGGITPEGGTRFSRPTAVEGTPVQRSLRERATQALDRFEKALNPIQRLPASDVYLKDRYETLGRIARIDDVAKEIRETLFRASEVDKRAAYRYFTTAGAQPDGFHSAAVREQAVRVKAMIGNVGDELVKRGLLSAEAHAAHADAYLPRLYLKHLLPQEDFAALGSGKKPSNMGYLKKRQDIPEEVRRIILGEITDPAFLSAVGIGTPMRDMALLDFLERISQNDQWVLPESLVEWNGRNVTPIWLKHEATRIRTQADYYTEADAKAARELASRMDETADRALAGMQGEHTDYRQMPDTPRYGMMRGVWVRKEIYEDIVGVYDLQARDPNWATSLLGYGGIGTKATQLWKAMKVSLNPPAQIRNFVSNGVLLQLSGVPLRHVPWRIFQAINEIRENGPHWQVAKKYGVTESTFAAQELHRIKRDLLELELSSRAMHPLKRLWKTAQIVGAKVMDPASDLYQLSEAIFKTAKIIDAMDREQAPEWQAAIEAQKWLFDYSMVPQSVRYLRNAPIGMPFLTFAYKVLPRLLEVAMHHPQRFIPWVALWYGMYALAMSGLGASDDDLEALRRLLPEWMRQRGHAMFLPVRDSAGRVSAVDVGYFFPWSMYTDAAQQLAGGDIGKAIGTVGLFSGPITSLVTAITTGTDPFTDKPIINPGDTGWMQGWSIANYVWDLAVPPIVSSRGLISPLGLADKQFGGKLVQATTGTTDRQGNPRATFEQAVLGAVGLPLYGIDPESARATELWKAQKEIDAVRLRLQSRMADRSLSESQRESLVNDYMEEIKDRYEKLAETAQKTQTSPAVAVAR